MGQRKPGLPFAHFFAAMALLILGCDKSTPHLPPSTQAMTVASLVPAATDLIEAMGMQSRLVAISNWDPDRKQYAKLPRVGDYRSIDWEKISQLQPAVMITQYREDKKPPGLEEKALQLHIKLVNVHNNTLEDLYRTLDQLGEALQAQSRAAAMKSQLQAELSVVSTKVAGKPRLRTLILRTATGLEAVGGGNYIDQILDISGGENVLAGGENSYPTIDRELLLKLDPEVILQLLPGASPQVVEQAQDSWKTLAQLQAVKNSRVYIMTEDYLLLPGGSVGKVAALFASRLHPEVSP
jgi:iron complex transport system substrate-binding protein